MEKERYKESERYKRLVAHDCMPCGYNEPCDSYLFGEAGVNLLIERIDKSKEKIKELEEALKKAREREIIIHQNYKHLQNQKAIEVLQEVKEKFGYKNNSQLVISSKYLCDFIDNKLKELKGEYN